MIWPSTTWRGNSKSLRAVGTATFMRWPAFVPVGTCTVTSCPLGACTLKGRWGWVFCGTTNSKDFWPEVGAFVGTASVLAPFIGCLGSGAVACARLRSPASRLPSRMSPKASRMSSIFSSMLPKRTGIVAKTAFVSSCCCCWSFPIWALILEFI